MVRGNKVYKYLTRAQEEAFAMRTVVGGHKHWAKVTIDAKTGTAIIKSKTGKTAWVTRRGKVVSGGLKPRDYGAYA